MKVIGAGFGRTGTLSLKGALETLGFGPCYHMTEVFEHPEHAPLWIAAANGTAHDWNAVFAGFEATVDWPAAAFYAQIAAAYPNAPVILTVRNPDRWYESCRQTIYPASGPDADSPSLTSANPIGQMIATVIWNGTFEGRFLDREFALSVFQRHIAEVRDCVPADRLLVYEVAQGWEPLCRFLGVQAPADTPFPHVNSTEDWRREANERAATLVDEKAGE